MSRREGLVRLRHMLESSREAVAMAEGKVRDDLETDRKLNLALVRLLEIVGEAASRATDEERALCRSIPWHQITGLRNRLIHGHDSVDMDILWQIIRDDLPLLIAELERVVRQRPF